MRRPMTVNQFDGRHPNFWTSGLCGWLGMLGCCVLLMVNTCGCRQPKNAASPTLENKSANRYSFQDVTQRAAVQASYENSEASQAYSILESLGGGVGVFDFDRDGRLDLWFPGGGQIDPQQESIQGLPSKLLRQQSEGLTFADRSSTARIDVIGFYTHGCSMADYDNDGFSDVLVTGYGGLQFFKNQGDGTFIEISQSIGLTDSKWSSSSGFGDLNRDGAVDVYVAHYVDWSWANNPKCQSSPPASLSDVCTPTRFKGLDDALYLNDGQGGFRDATAGSGMVAEGKGLGVVLADIDSDDDVDVYVANDTTENFLYINDGHGSLTETGLVSGTALDQRGTPNGSMGLAVLDFDGDNRSDIWVTNFENETFSMYRNQGEGNFLCVTESTGITAIGTLYVGFGTTAVDIDLDGDEDLVVSNGHVQQRPGSATVAQHPLLLLNEGRGRLQKREFTDDAYFQSRHRGRSVVTADFNADGLGDLVFSHIKEPAALLLNQCDRQGHWIALQLVGTATNRDAIGARVELKAAGRTMLRQVVGGGGYLSQAPYTLHWGIPVQNSASSPSSAVAAVIHWPDGQVQSLDALTPGQTYLIVQADHR